MSERESRREVLLLLCTTALFLLARAAEHFLVYRGFVAPRLRPEAPVPVTLWLPSEMPSAVLCLAAGWRLGALRWAGAYALVITFASQAFEQLLAIHGDRALFGRFRSEDPLVFWTVITEEKLALYLSLFCAASVLGRLTRGQLQAPGAPPPHPLGGT